MACRYRYAVTALQMRALDESATRDYGIPSLTLMENAGRSVAEAAVQMLGDVRGRRVLIVCGTGNNGGDGYVAARHLAKAGAVVVIGRCGDPAAVHGDALANMQAAEQMGLEIRPVTAPGDVLAAAADADLIVDAMLGTGATGSVREPYAGAIGAVGELRATGLPVVAVDIPSGIDSDSGAPLGPAVRADVTVTFAMPKLGLLMQPGASHVGRLVVADIGIPPDAAAGMNLNTYVLDPSALCDICRPIPPDANKGDMGRVAVIAGSVGLTGAAVLSATGALRTGAGLVTVAVPESLNDVLEVKLTEAMTVPAPQGVARAFGLASLEVVLELIDKSDAAVIGPGLGRHEDTVAFTLELIGRLAKPAVVDADALYAISSSPDVLNKCKAPLVLTPHPGEMARLLDTDVRDVQSRRLECAREFARERQVAVVLKGAATVVAFPDGGACINTSGTPGMATGGTGDVLSGMMGALVARHGVSPGSVGGAVYLHGLAGETAAAQYGEESMLASDLAASIGEALRQVRGKLQEPGEE